MGTSHGRTGQGVMGASYISHAFLCLAVLCRDQAAVKGENKHLLFLSDRREALVIPMT